MSDDAFKWLPNQDQRYTDPKSDTLVGLSHEFKKEDGTSFTMDAPESTLALDVTDDRDIYWGMREGPLIHVRAGTFAVGGQGRLIITGETRTTGVRVDGQGTFEVNMPTLGNWAPIKMAGEGACSVDVKTFDHEGEWSIDDAAHMTVHADIAFIGGKIEVSSLAPPTAESLEIIVGGDVYIGGGSLTCASHARVLISVPDTPTPRSRERLQEYAKAAGKTIPLHDAPLSFEAFHMLAKDNAHIVLQAEQQQFDAESNLTIGPGKCSITLGAASGAPILTLDNVGSYHAGLFKFSCQAGLDHQGKLRFAQQGSGFLFAAMMEKGLLDVVGTDAPKYRLEWLMEDGYFTIMLKKS